MVIIALGTYTVKFRPQLKTAISDITYVLSILEQLQKLLTMFSDAIQATATEKEGEITDAEAEKIAAEIKKLITDEQFMDVLENMKILMEGSDIKYLIRKYKV